MMKGDLPLTPDDVNEIVAILDGSVFDTLSINTGQFRLQVVRNGSGEATGWTQNWDWKDDTGAAGAVASATDVTALPEGITAVASPLPGTFYRAPQPGAPNFVEVGDSVGPETVVGIIETMKLMNPVHAGVSGTIEAIIVENAAMVESGAVLIHVRATA
jgi:acetyl-CoA carboxylase biotin carboxyl carrier protein